MVMVPGADEGETKELLRLREQKRREDGGAIARSSSSHRSHEPEEMSAYKRRKWVLFSIIGGFIYGYNVRYDTSH